MRPWLRRLWNFIIRTVGGEIVKAISRQLWNFLWPLVPPFVFRRRLQLLKGRKRALQDKMRWLKRIRHTPVQELTGAVARIAVAVALLAIGIALIIPAEMQLHFAPDFHTRPAIYQVEIWATLLLG